MRVPQLQFTVRRMVGAILIVSLILALVIESERATRPHRVIMAEAPTEALALEELRRQIDAIEDAAGDGAIARRGPAC